MLKEVLIVEGKMDTAAVKKALEAETIETGGFTLSPSTLRKISAAYEKRGIIILTHRSGRCRRKNQEIPDGTLPTGGSGLCAENGRDGKQRRRYRTGSA